jgi:hypothetical protein
MAALILSIVACIAIVCDCLARPLAADRPSPKTDRVSPYRD